MSDMQVWPNEVIIKQLEFAAQYPPNYDQVCNNWVFQKIPKAEGFSVRCNFPTQP